MEIAYFTIGELSKIYNISKQTLMYYEKINLLKPHKIEENGYRYYTLLECNRLEIIINLKKLNIPLKEIGEYLDNKDTNSLEKLLGEARYTLDEQLSKLYTKKMKLEMALYNLERDLKVPTDVVFFQMEEEKIYFETNYAKGADGTKEGALCYLKHQATLLDTEDFWDFHTGVTVCAEDFEAGRVLEFESYCTNSKDESLIDESEMEGEKFRRLVIRPRGMYLVLYIHGDYRPQAMRVQERFVKFWKENNLDIAGTVYIEPVRNYWTESSKDDYVMRITVPVEKIN